MIAPHLILQVVPVPVDFDQSFETAELLDIAIAVFALVLLALSISAYRKTHLRRLLIVSLAFLLFAVDVVIRQLDVFVFALGFQTDQIITSGVEFVILFLFFLAVVTKE